MPDRWQSFCVPTRLNRRTLLQAAEWCMMKEKRSNSQAGVCKLVSSIHSLVLMTSHIPILPYHKGDFIWADSSLLYLFYCKQIQSGFVEDYRPRHEVLSLNPLCICIHLNHFAAPMHQFPPFYVHLPAAAWLWNTATKGSSMLEGGSGGVDRYKQPRSKSWFSQMGKSQSWISDKRDVNESK